MEMLQDLFIGLENRGLIIGNVVLLAKISNDVLDFFQSVSGNAWEEVMLDLVVESAIPEIREGAWFDIARREHLPAKEVDLIVLC